MKNPKFRLNIQFFAEDNPQPEKVDPNQPPVPQPDTTPKNPADVYADALDEMKAHTVPKEEYEKVLAERDTLVKRSLTQRELHLNPQPETVDLNQIRKELFTEHITNYDYVQKALKLRQGIIDQGGRDIFVSPTSGRVEEDEKEARKVAKIMQECLDFCKDNHELFPSVLQSRLVDDPSLKMALSARKAKG